MILKNFSEKIDIKNFGTIVELFEEQVRKTPNESALKFKDNQFNYSKLNDMSNRLAHYILDKYNIKIEDLIGIELERSEWVVIGMLAILKTGGAYVPIDPEYPLQRKEFIKEDAKLKFVLNESEIEEFKIANQQTILQNSNPGKKVISENLIYVLYTSGSTGFPKGVLVEHKSVVRLSLQPDYITLLKNDKIIQISPFEFDASTFEIWTALLNGLELVVVSKMDMLNPAILHNLILNERITIAWFTASLLNQFVESYIQIFERFRIILTGGEKLSVSHINQIVQKFPTVTLINAYGPTENTTFSTTYVINKNFTQDIPIGKPIRGTSVLILDENNNILPINSIGEICLSGSGLGRGYLNQNELTEEKFIYLNYADNLRIYKTGDRGKITADNELEYLGRIDDQVKIRGHRIETGEIEHVLSGHPGVGQVVVLAKELMNGSEKELIAYTTGSAQGNDLKLYLKDLLPNYMIPNFFVKLLSLPLTKNGKIDKMSLPLPNAPIKNIEKFRAAKTITEHYLVQVWAQVFNREESELSINDDFFDLGGHSIKAIKMFAQIYKHFGVKMSLKELFLHRDIEKLGRLLDGLKVQEKYNPISQVSLQNDYTISSAQERLWMLSQLEEANKAYNITQVFHLNGFIHESSFAKAYSALLERHEILRTVFLVDTEGNPRQSILPITKPFFRVEFQNIYELPFSEKKVLIDAMIQDQSSKCFDLEKGPLM